MEANFEGGQGPEGAAVPWMAGWMEMTRAEQAYSASEAAMLALVWATKHFRCYLCGKQFLVEIDHAAVLLKKFCGPQVG
jgi:hypothetical protein